MKQDLLLRGTAMYKKFSTIVLPFLVIMYLTGCGGTRTFHEYARAGDTVAVAAGLKSHFTRENITVTITPAAGTPITYPLGDPSLRAVINLYPDPLASILVSQEIGLDQTPYARDYANLVNLAFTAGDKDWWQTTVFIDLPDSLSPGPATIDITNAEGDTASSTVEIVDGTGVANTFSTEINGPLSPNQLLSLERVTHNTITFTGSHVPYALQANLSHDPDSTLGGTGKTYVCNTRGDIKNVSWSDNGTDLKVLITPSGTTPLQSFTDFKIYVAGGITGLTITNVAGVNSDGVPVEGISAYIQ